MLLWSMAALAAPCDQPVALDVFRQGLDVGFELEGAELREQVLTSERQLACLEGPLTVEDAAAFHRNRALSSASAGDAESALAAATASLRLAPEGAGVWGEANAAFALLLDEPIPSPPHETVPMSLAASVYSDGLAGARRVPGQPVIVQLFAHDGSPRGGAWVSPRDALPVWVSFPEVSCEERLPVGRVVQEVTVAKTAYEELDLGGFRAALQRVAVGLPCVDGVLLPEQAAAIHRLEGIRLATQGASLQTVRAFQEARVLDPSFMPSADLLAPGSRVEGLWKAAGDANPAPWFAMDVPEGATTFVDGLATDRRPATLPSIVQVLGPDGELLRTQFVPSASILPSLDELVVIEEVDAFAGLTPAMRIYREADERQARLRRRQPLRLTGVGLLAASAGLFVGNVVAASTFDDPTTHPDRLPRLAKTTQATRWLSFSFVLVGAGSVVASEL